MNKKQCEILLEQNTLSLSRNYTEFQKLISEKEHLLRKLKECKLNEQEEYE